MTDIATVEHWESVWRRKFRVRPISQRNYYDTRFCRLFAPLVTARSRVLEVGCGGSRWLPYFDCFLNCEVWGIDYSLKGLNLAKRNLLATSACRLVLGDFFDERLLPKNYFDLIYSLGFIDFSTCSNQVE
jgi:SAM-dependent methyltransferase